MNSYQAASFTQSSGFWAILVSRVLNISAVCQALWAFPLHHSLSPMAQFKSTQTSGLGFTVIFSGKPSLTTSSLSQISHICTQNSPYYFIATVKVVTNCVIIGLLLSLLAGHKRKGPCLSCPLLVTKYKIRHIVGAH